MEDIYKDDPNSWLKRTRFSKTVYHCPDPSKIPVIPLAELKSWYSDLNSNWTTASTPVTWDNTFKTSQSTTMPTLKSNDSSLTSEVQEGSDSETNKNEPASKIKALSDMLKAVKDTVRRKFVSQSPRDRMQAKTVRSPSRPKKESRWLKKCFDREVHHVSAQQKSNEVH